MTLKTYIQNDVLLPRLTKHTVLVVYDPARRYHELCREMADEGHRINVVDASASSLESREAAQAALLVLGQTARPFDSLLIYVPAAPPLSDEDKQGDPFSMYAECGAAFPASDGDEFQSLCLRAKADFPSDIRRIFAETQNPSFEMIDAVGGGAGWPQLQALLQVESARDILFCLLAPSDKQKDALAKQDSWAAEAKTLLQTTLGQVLQTRAKKWPVMAEEIWRFVLFSEFAFDLPVALPDALANVPRARDEAAPLIEDLCERLRNDQRTQGQYIERAATIESDLSLPTACHSITDLGVRDTFAFEERTFFAQAVDAMLRDDADRLRAVLGRQSIWMKRGDNLAQWALLKAGADLVQACQDAERQLPTHSHSQAALLDFYVSGLRDVDHRQRLFEQAAGDHFDSSGELAKVVQRARTVYRKVADLAQNVFVRHLEKGTWPPVGRLANADVFDKLVAPKLQESGRRVALFLVDALRYELGVELHKQLIDDGATELQATYAQLPSVTPVGMASLLPNAGQDLQLTRRADKLVLVLAGQPLANVGQRMDVLRKRYGQRFAEVGLKEFVRDKPSFPDRVELLVIRTNEMDALFESNLETALNSVSKTFQQVRAALHKLRGLGFQDAIIATDHGFYLNTSAQAGDVCEKPAGNWVAVHDRMLLGDGSAHAGSVVLPAQTLGIQGDFAQAALPRAMIAYQAGVHYFHGGASLQEAVLPVIGVRLSSEEKQTGKKPKVTLTYKRGSKRITTRLPVVDISVDGDAEQIALFADEPAVEVLIEAHNKAGEVVGEAKVGGPVNAATRTVSARRGETVQVTLRMDETFEGKFTIKVLDPLTFATFSKLDLETDYTV